MNLGNFFLSSSYCSLNNVSVKLNLGKKSSYNFEDMDKVNTKTCFFVSQRCRHSREIYRSCCSQSECCCLIRQDHQVRQCCKRAWFCSESLLYMMRFLSEYLLLLYIKKKVSKYSERQIPNFQHSEINLKKFKENEN